VLRFEGNVGANCEGVLGVVCERVRRGTREGEGGKVEVVRVGQDLCCVC
jgi:hypothetical protein